MKAATNKIAIFAVMIYIVAGFLIDPACRAESKSEMIKRLRNKSCQEDVSQTTAQLAHLQQFQADFIQANNTIGSTSAHRANTALTHLLTALTNHSHSKQSVCKRLKPEGAQAGAHPEGYEGLSKSERIGRLKTDYCADVRQNGESILKNIIQLKTMMKKVLAHPSGEDSLKAVIDRVQNSWSETVPIVDALNSEQTMASNICQSLTQGISKTELIQKSKQGLEKGGHLPHFWYLITYD